MRRYCDEKGILLIVDEAQTGIGRTGKWFAYQHYDITPDIITLSKSLGGGVPLSGVVVKESVAENAKAKSFYQSSSHTGDPLLCAVGLANIQIIEEEGVVENARVVGALLRDTLQERLAPYPFVGEVRGLGMMIGIEVVDNRRARRPDPMRATALSTGCFRNGLLVGHRPGVVGGNVIRILPPLNITEEEAHVIADRIAEAARRAA